MIPRNHIFLNPWFDLSRYSRDVQVELCDSSNLTVVSVNMLWGTGNNKIKGRIKQKLIICQKLLLYLLAELPSRTYLLFMVSFFAIILKIASIKN